MNVRLTKARAFELDPKKAYILFLKKNAFDEDKAHKLQDELTKQKISNVITVLAEKNSYKLVEASQAEAKLKKNAVQKVKAEAKKNKTKE